MMTYILGTDSMSFASPQSLVIDKEGSNTPVKVNGTSGNDEIYGSDYSDTLNGNAGNDEIYGGFGNDKINGGLGKDHLYGDDGKDTFVFTTKLSASNVDRIGDFRTKDDTIQLERDIFKWAGQKGGEIKASEFKVIGDGQKVDANDHIIYNQKTGALYYDVDGKGGHAMVKFAVLDNYSGDVPILTHHDILLG